MKWDRDETSVNRYMVVPNFLSPRKCDELLEIRKGLEEHPGKVLSIGEDESYEDDRIRKSNHAVWPKGDPKHIEDLYRRLKEVNDKHFGFQVSCVESPFNIVRYGPGDFFKCHGDNNIIGGKRFSFRKLTTSVMLSDGDQIGGSLRLYFGSRSINSPVQLRLGKGDAVFFPPWVLHEAEEVVAGHRYSLVCWLTGRPFR